MQCLLKLCIVGLALVAHGHAAPQTPGPYAFLYKRSILSNPTTSIDGLSGFNGYGTPLNFGYNQGFSTAYSPGLSSNYGFGDLRLHHSRAFGSPTDFQYSQYSTPLNFGFDAASYPFSTTPLQFGAPAVTSSSQLYYPNAVQQVPASQYKMMTTIPAKTTLQGNVALQSVQSGPISQQPNAYSVANGKLSNPNVAPQQLQYPAVQDERQVRVLRPMMSSNADQTYQISSSYQPIPASSDVAAAQPSPSSEGVPNLILELRPPLYSATSFDYSKNPNPSSIASATSSDNSFIDFGSVSGNSNSNNQNNAAYSVSSGNSDPSTGNQYREPHSLNTNAYNVPVANGPNGASNSIQNTYSALPSLSYTIPSGSYRQSDPVSINNYFSSSGPVSSNNAPKSIPNNANNVLSNNLYSESDPSSVNTFSTPIPVSSDTNTASNAFPNVYFNNLPSNVQNTYQNTISSASFSSNSNPISANSYSDSNLIQSSSYNTPSSFSNSKLNPTNTYSDSNSISNNNKRESFNNVVVQSNKPQFNYYSNAADYKGEQRA